MATPWTEVVDVLTGWTGTADKSTSYTEVVDEETQWGMFGGLIKICTEGYREDLMAEARIDYIVYSHGEDVEIWTDTADVSTTYTKISDI